MISSELREEFALLLEEHVPGYRLAGTKATGHVPWREDNHPSFSADLEKGVWFDHARQEGDNVKEFKERLNLTDNKPSRKIVATYDYIDEHGVLLYQVVLVEPKDFRQRKPDGNGGWTWKLNGVRRVLYRLPEIREKSSVFLVEGEKDTDRLQATRLPATTCPGGAGKWREEYTHALRGKHVVILPDNDPVGEQHALTVARSLLPEAASVRILRLPGLPSKGDVSDWLDAGHTRDELIALAKAAPILKPEDVKGELPSHNGLTLTKLSDVTPQALRWLWRGYIPLGKVTIIDGDPGLGKSLLSLDIAGRASRGRTMPDGTRTDLPEPAGVVLLSLEDDPADTIRPRLEAADADLERIVLLTTIHEEKGERIPTLADLDAIKHAIEAVTAKLVIIDPLMAYLPSASNAHKDQDIRRTLAPVAKLAAETGVAVVVIRHLNKSEGRNPLYRGGGSIGIIGAARSGLVVANDPEDETRRILAVAKANLAKPAPALAYRIESTVDEVPFLVWEGATAHTASSLLAQHNDSDEERSALDDAKGFLRDLLKVGAVPAKEVQEQADQAGISYATLRRAKTALKVLTRKQDGFFSKKGSQWCWMLPVEDAQDPAEDAQTLEHEHLQQSSEKNTRKFNDVPEDAQTSENEHLQHTDEHLQSSFYKCEDEL